MDSETFFTLSTVAKYTTIIPFLVGFAFRKSLSREQKKIWGLVVLYLLVEIIVNKYFTENVWQYVFGRYSNLPLLHLFTVAQLVFILRIYRWFLIDKIGRKNYLALGIGFAAFALINAIWIDGIFLLNPHARGLQSLILLPVAIGYLLNLMRKMEVTRLEADPLFWISAFVIIYFSGSFFIFLGSNYFLPDPSLLISIYGIHSILSIIALILFTIALWIKHRQSPTTSP